MTRTSPRTARRTHGFTESVIREMTRVAREHDSLNLAQGFPDFPAPDLLKEAACRAIRDDINQYAVTWGAPRLRHAVAAAYGRFYGMDVDPDREITVTCGATEAVASVILALVDPGDGVVVFEPFYENYGPDAVLAGANPQPVSLTAPDFRLERDTLERAMDATTRVIVFNSPNNPTGRVFSDPELELLATVARERDLLVVTDEIYEHIVYEGSHRPLATLPGMRERTVTVSGLSKTFAITGWRIGTIVAPPDLTSAIRKVHDFLTVGAPAPLQEACATGLEELGSDYYDELERSYRRRRDVLVEGLSASGFRCRSPEGAYYVLADFSELSGADDHTFSVELTRAAGVTPVPGSSFFQTPGAGRSLVRFAFCKRVATLERAVEKLLAFRSAGS